jgi:hypothetical protein
MNNREQSLAHALHDLIKHRYVYYKEGGGGGGTRTEAEEIVY